MTVPSIQLHDGTSIPQLGFGVFQINPADTAEAVTRALEVGYRHIDTAEMYGNEKQVGEALRSSGVARDDVYVTSKLNNGFHRPDDAERAFEKTLADLGLDRIDLFLVHWPLPTRYDGDFVSTWRTMASFVEDGRAASVGVSNFQPDHLQRIVDEGVAWAHLDIAGVAWSDKPKATYDKGATGYGVRLLDEYVATTLEK